MIGFEMKVAGNDFQGQGTSGLSSGWQASEGSPLWPVDGKTLDEVAGGLAGAMFNMAWKDLSGSNHIYLSLRHDTDASDKDSHSRQFDIHDEESMKELIKYLLDNGMSGGNVLHSIAEVLNQVAKSSVESSGGGRSVVIGMDIDL